MCVYVGVCVCVTHFHPHNHPHTHPHTHTLFLSQVGDYILSPEICVERKSLSDLRSSFQSGRLYNQIQAMCKYYKTPVLLVEFDADKAFLLQSPVEIGGSEVNNASLGSKLALLTAHFPRLRLVWSKTLHATAEMFAQLKALQQEPDPIAAAAAGVWVWWVYGAVCDVGMWCDLCGCG